MLSLQIDLILDAEKTIPGRFRKKFVAKNQVLYPNRKRDLFSKLRLKENLMKELEKILKAEKVNFHIFIYCSLYFLKDD